MISLLQSYIYSFQKEMCFFSGDVQAIAVYIGCREGKAISNM